MKRKYNVICAVPCCGYRQPSKDSVGSANRRTMFVFPRDKELAKMWIDQIDGLAEIHVKMNSKICDAHFEKDRIVKQKSRSNLCPNAIPTLKLKCQVSPCCKSPNSKNQENRNPNTRKKCNSAKNTKHRKNCTPKGKNNSKIPMNANAASSSRGQKNSNASGTSNSKGQENKTYNHEGTDPMSRENLGFDPNGASSSKKHEIMSPQVLRKNKITPETAQQLQSAVVKLDKTLNTATSTIQKSCDAANNVIEFIDLTEQNADDKCKIVKIVEPKTDPGWKDEAPEPQLKISRLSNGIRLIWNMDLNDSIADIAWYELYACKVGTPADAVARWKKIGEVQAFDLPMSCDLLGQAFTEGKNCLFAIRAVDVHTRSGPYSNTCVL